MKIIYGFRPLNILTKSSILDVRQGSKYAFEWNVRYLYTVSRISIKYFVSIKFISQSILETLTYSFCGQNQMWFWCF